MASGELATLFRSGVAAGTPVCVPEVLACSQVYPYRSRTGMDTREPGCQVSKACACVVHSRALASVINPSLLVAQGLPWCPRPSSRGQPFPTGSH